MPDIGQQQVITARRCLLGGASGQKAIPARSRVNDHWLMPLRAHLLADHSSYGIWPIACRDA
jgi:hypothetical protein